MRNDYKIIGDTTHIYIDSKGVRYTATIDTVDLDLVKNYRWTIKHSKKTRYARSDFNLSGTRHRVYMHRLILDANKDMVVDHDDHNGLNNTRSNIKEVSQSDNMKNSITCLYAKGTTYDKQKKRYRATIRGKHIGWYLTLEEATNARGLALIEETL